MAYLVARVHRAVKPLFVRLHSEVPSASSARVYYFLCNACILSTPATSCQPRQQPVSNIVVALQ